MYNKDHEVNGKLHKHLCSFCLSQGRFQGHAEKRCVFCAKKNSTKKSCPSKTYGRGNNAKFCNNVCTVDDIKKCLALSGQVESMHSKKV